MQAVQAHLLQLFFRICEPSGGEPMRRLCVLRSFFACGRRCPVVIDSLESPGENHQIHFPKWKCGSTYCGWTTVLHHRSESLKWLDSPAKYPQTMASTTVSTWCRVSCLHGMSSSDRFPLTPTGERTIFISANGSVLVENEYVAPSRNWAAHSDVLCVPLVSLDPRKWAKQ